MNIFQKAQTIVGLKALTFAGFGFLLFACGGGSSNSVNQPPNRLNPLPDYSLLKPTDVTATVLKPADNISLERHIKNGLRLNSQREVFPQNGVEFIATPSLAADNTSNSGTSSPRYSETNTHVEGVDESDYVKYDGSNIFVSTHPQWYWNDAKPDSKVRILETDPAQATAQEVASIPLNDNNWGPARELYLVKDSSTDNTKGLATLRSTWSYFCWLEPNIMQVDTLFADDSYTPVNRDAVQVAVYDVVDPTTPNLDWTLSIDGYLQESRKIGNTLYLVTQFLPSIRGLDFYPANDQKRRGNEDLIVQATLNDLLPSYRVNDGSAQPLVDAENCYIPADIDENNGLASLTTLVAIDLESKQITSSVCLNAHVEGIYASLENLYIGGSTAAGWWANNSETVIHKFNLENGAINYRSTASVPGYLGWDDPSFRMNEHNEHFHIVTTSRTSNGDPVHQLTVLKDNPVTDVMQTVATLPNSTRPSPIGKPGEDIYSVRFRDDRAYIVTFERIDPLYVIDLSIPADPKIAGELEVPGFSSYLHPVSDNYLLGFGREVTDMGTGGVKVSLYDVSDTANPLELNSTVIGGTGSYSEALYDLHAASFLYTSADQLRFTMPINTYANTNNYQWSHNGLLLFEINGISTPSAALAKVGEIIAEEASAEILWPSNYQSPRSVLHDDAVYFLYGGSVFSSFWTSPQAAIGPY